MAKFVLLNQGDTTPLQTYEGDYMQHQGEYVTIRTYSKEGGSLLGEVVAAIRLDKGQSVKQLE